MSSSPDPSAPPTRRVLLTPGPATTSQGVKDVLGAPDVSPREDVFCALLADVRRRLAALAGEPARISAIPVAGSGTTALEAALVSLVPESGLALILDNGDYGRRLVEIARACGIPHRVLAPGWGVPIEPGAVARALAWGDPPASHLVFVHHETSTGMQNPLRALSRVGRAAGVAVLVDAMSSFGALPIRVAPGEGGVDALVSSANKCLQGIAGLAFAIVTRELLETARRSPPRSLALDLVAELDHLEKTGQTRFTCPPQVVYALARALVELDAEGGPEARRARYARSMATLVAGLRRLGFELLLPDEQQSGILVAVREPRAEWYAFRDLHDALAARGFTIYPGKAGPTPTFRLAVLGDLRVADIEAFLAALRDVVAAARQSR